MKIHFLFYEILIRHGLISIKEYEKLFIVVSECVIQGKDLFVLAIIHAAQYVMYLYRPDISIASLITVVGACKSYSIVCLHKSPETNMKKIAQNRRKTAR